MKKILLLLILLFSFLFIPTQSINARSGCCSHHGGVCGCGCCDGSSLSSTCAPYYPNCQKTKYIAPTIKPQPTITTVPEVKAITTTNTPTPIQNQNGSNSNSSSIIPIAIVGLIIFIIYKKINNRNKIDNIINNNK